MRWMLWCVICVVMARPVGAGTGSGADAADQSEPAVQAEVARWVQAELPELVRFYEERHRQPELSLHEQASAEAVAGRLRAAGFEVTTGIGGFGVAGVLRNGDGPTVLIRGDMDALPIREATGLPYASTVEATGADGRPVGVMHACGHDVHMTCLVGTAAVLAATREHWRGTVVAIGQPAEEIGRGAAAMIQDGLLEQVPRPDACVALHVAADLPAGSVAYTPGWATANVDSVDITIYGRGGHGSRPHTTVDPIVTAAELVVALQTVVSRRVDPVEPAVITVGSLHAGSKHNIIPDEARLQLTVRSFSDQTRQVLLKGIREVTEGTCQAMGCPRPPEILLRSSDFTPSGYHDPAFAATAAQAMAGVVGAEQVHTLPPQTVGEDFARYGRALEVPALLFWLGSMNPEAYEAAVAAGEPLPALHTASLAPDPEPTIATGIRCTAAIALSVLDAGSRDPGEAR